MPILLKIMASSLIRAMLTSRWVFSITLAASATRMLGALWVPAVMMLAVQRVDDVGHFGRGAGGDLLDGGQPVRFVAGVDALGAVAGEEVDVELQAREFFQHGHAVFLGGAGVDGGFVDHDVAGFQHPAHGLAGADQGREVGLLVFVDGRGHGDDEAGAGAQGFHVRGEAQVAGGGQLGGSVSSVWSRPACSSAMRWALMSKPDDGAAFAEFDRQRQADVAEADDGDFVGFWVHGVDYVFHSTV